MYCGTPYYLKVYAATSYSRTYTYIHLGILNSA